MTMKNLFRKTLAVAVVLALAVLPATALDVPVQQAVGVSGALSAVSTDVALWVKYVGTSTFTTKPTIAVAAADADIALTINGAADTTITGCGGTAGTLDTAQTGCDTLGELCNRMNASANWACVVESALASDASANALDTVAASDAVTQPGGLGLKKDTVVALNVVVPLRPGITGDWYFQGNAINPNPFGGFYTFVQAIRENVTSGGTVGEFMVIGVTPKVVGVGASKVYSETVRTIWSEPGAATTVEKNLSFINFPLMTVPGEKVLVKISATSTLTAPKLNAVGVLAKAR
jgi:hypothetical protein